MKLLIYIYLLIKNITWIYFLELDWKYEVSVVTILSMKSGLSL